MRNIPEDNLAYPVFLNWNTGSTGSGFNLQHHNKTFFVTAKHVLFNSKGELLGQNLKLVCQTKDINDDSTFEFDVNISHLFAKGLVYLHPNYDVAAFLLSTANDKTNPNYFIPVEGVEIVKRSETSIVVSVLSSEAILFIDEVLVSNDIFLYGYPTSLGLKHSPQFDYSKPLLRKGIVSSVYKNMGTIILDCPVYYGNSGGPVVQVELVGNVYHHRVIGVVSQFIPYSENWQNLSNGIVHTEISNSGFSVAVAMNYVFEMLNIQR